MPTLPLPYLALFNHMQLPGIMAAWHSDLRHPGHKRLISLVQSLCPLNEQSLPQDITRPVEKSCTDRDKENTPSSRLLNAYITQRLPPFLNAAASG